jgi:hypothetical protein
MGVLERPVKLRAKDALQLKWKLVDLTECRSYNACLEVASL